MLKLIDGTELTSEVKEAFKRGVTKAYIQLTDGTKLSSSDYLKDLKLEDFRYNEETKNIIGEAIAKRTTIGLFNQENAVNLENKEFQLFIGAKLLDNTIAWIDYGNYIVQKPENNDTKESTEFEAFDYMIKFNKTYEHRVTLPCTYAELAADVCDQCGVELGNSTFRNSDKLVSENFFIDGEQCRVVIKQIAKIAFSWARIGTDNKLYFDFMVKDMSQPDESFTLDDYKELEKNNTTIPINTIVLRSSAVESENITIYDDDLIAEYGEQKELVIEEDYFAYSQELRQELIEAGRELMGLFYNPISVKSIGTIYLESNDVIAVEDKSGNMISTYCFNHIIDYNGVLFDELESPAMTEVQTQYKHESALDLSIRRTEILVNKATQEIQLIASKKVNNDEIIARINMAIQSIEEDENGEIPEDVEKSIIEIIANKISIQSDYTQLTSTGFFSTISAKIANWYLNDGVLFANTQIGDIIYQSGLDSRSNDYMLYAGLDVTNGSNTLNNSNAYITKSGKMYAKWFEVNGESGHFIIRYDGGNRAVQHSIDGTRYFVNDDANGYYGFMGCFNGNMRIDLNDSPFFYMMDNLHYGSDFFTMCAFARYDPNSSNQNIKNRHVFDFNGSIFCYGYGADNINNTMYIQGYEVATNASDERLKENIQKCNESALDVINQIPMISFNWGKDTHRKDAGEHIRFGYGAQRTQKVYDKAVIHNKENDTYQMDILNLSALHTKSIQELSEENKKLKNKISDLEKRLVKLENMIGVDNNE